MLGVVRSIIAKFFKAKNVRSSEGGVTDNNQLGLVGQNSLHAKKKHDLIFWAVIGLGVLLVFCWSGYKSQVKPTAGSSKDEEKEPLKLEVASEALDSEKMWRNHFEDKLGEITSKTNEKMQLIENSINEQAAANSNNLKVELENLRAQIKYLSEEQVATKKELLNSRLQLEQAKETGERSEGDAIRNLPSSIKVNNLERGETFDTPKSSRKYIPETAYVTGVLLNGLAVSTAIGSRGEPVAVDIKITDRGSLPKNFDIDLKTCKILGSSYGDLSSERAIIRAEILSCTDPTSEMIYTTKIVGQVFGDDGINGVKGRVVQTSNRHLKNAVLGSMISGFTSSTKSQGQFAVSSIGAISTKQQGVADVFKNGALEGMGNSGERIADYYIKQAESMSPVLVIRGGTKVDVLFTKGVYLGGKDVKQKIEEERK